MKRITPVLFFLMIPAVVFGLDAVPDSPDLFSAIVAAVFNIKNLQTVGIAAAGMSAIVVIMQVLKKVLGDFRFKEIAVVLLSVAYTVFASMAAGMGVAESVLSALFTGGGAMAIFNSIKKEVDGKTKLRVVP